MSYSFHRRTGCDLALVGSSVIGKREKLVIEDPNKKLIS